MEIKDLQTQSILSEISKLRVNEEIPSCGGLFNGGQCCILKADFTNADSWAVRIYGHGRDNSLSAVISVALEETKILKKLEEKGFKWSAHYIGSNLSSDNPIQQPYLVYSWVHGHSLHWSLDFPPRPHRNKILSQLAMVQEALYQCTQERRMFRSNLSTNLIDLFP